VPAESGRDYGAGAAGDGGAVEDHGGEVWIQDGIRAISERTAASGQADGGELTFFDDAGEVDLDTDDAGIDAIDGGAAGFEKHIGDRCSA
jgi:hypothetical protein